MFIQVNQSNPPHAYIKQRFAMSRTLFAVAASLIETMAIFALSLVTGAIWHLAVYGESGSLEVFAAIGSLAALSYSLPLLLRGEFDLEHIVEGRRKLGRSILAWLGAFAALAVIGFLTKTTGVFSRGWLLIFFVSGLVMVPVLNRVMAMFADAFSRSSYVVRRKLMLVGTLDEVQRLKNEIDSASMAAHIVAAAVLPSNLDATDKEIVRRLQAAALKARALAVDDIVIAVKWSKMQIIEAAVTQFSELPAVVHIGAGPVLGRFREAKVSRFGQAATLSVTKEPLEPLEALIKRALDLVLGSIALFLLAPLFAVVALLIKLDSPGPVFFRQRRRGYNLEEFQIWKFRSMTVTEDGPVVVQAQKNDVRVTRIGAFLRRYNIDELPQLINVIRGEMSLVGPRPHAVAHDEFFEKRIAKYPRRLNVKPGITGWAQVNGLRGATQTDEIMAARVEHDLHYIENWSIMFDLYIMLLTVFSRRAQMNAY